MEPLTADERTATLAALPDWRYVLGALRTAFVCPTPGAALRFIAALAAVSEQVDHHPDVDWRYRHVFVTLATHSAGHRVTARDTDLAGAISAAARAQDAVADPRLVRTVEIAVDTTEADRIAPAWAQALGYVSDGDDALADPFRRGPAVWFQITETPASSRIHLDVTVEDDFAPAVLTEAQSAGGRIIDRYKRSFTVFADADDNRICICTNLDRD